MNNEVLPMVVAMLELTILALKHFYGIVGDKTAYGELSVILGQLSPRMLNELNDEQVQKQISDFSVPCQKPPPMWASDRCSMKVHENKEVFGQNFVCQHAWAALGER
jgi:hypothetical protein